jgi:hypothetical protein
VTRLPQRPGWAFVSFFGSVQSYYLPQLYLLNKIHSYYSSSMSFSFHSSCYSYPESILTDVGEQLLKLYNSIKSKLSKAIDKL